MRVETAAERSPELPFTREQVINAFNKAVFNWHVKIHKLNEEIDPRIELDDLADTGLMDEDQRRQAYEFRRFQKGVRALTETGVLLLGSLLHKDTVTVEFGGYEREEGLDISGLLDSIRDDIKTGEKELKESESSLYWSARFAEDLASYKEQLRILESSSVPYEEVFPGAFDDTNPVEKARRQEEARRIWKHPLSRQPSPEKDFEEADRYLRKARLLVLPKKDPKKEPVPAKPVPVKSEPAVVEPGPIADEPEPIKPEDDELRLPVAGRGSARWARVPAEIPADVYKGKGCIRAGLGLLAAVGLVAALLSLSRDTVNNTTNPAVEGKSTTPPMPEIQPEPELVQPGYQLVPDPAVSLPSGIQPEGTAPADALPAAPVLNSETTPADLAARTKPEKMIPVLPQGTIDYQIQSGDTLLQIAIDNLRTSGVYKGTDTIPYEVATAVALNIAKVSGVVDPNIIYAGGALVINQADLAALKTIHEKDPRALLSLQNWVKPGMAQAALRQVGALLDRQP